MANPIGFSNGEPPDPEDFVKLLKQIKRAGTWTLAPRCKIAGGGSAAIVRAGTASIEVYAACLLLFRDGWRFLRAVGTSRFVGTFSYIGFFRPVADIRLLIRLVG
jgi:hypothetical protein